MLLTEFTEIDEHLLDNFCRRWKIVALESFDSAFSASGCAFHFLATFQKDAEWGLLEHSRMENELSELLGRTVELVSRRAIETSQDAPLRTGILHSARLVYGRS